MNELSINISVYIVITKYYYYFLDYFCNIDSINLDILYAYEFLDMKHKIPKRSKKLDVNDLGRSYILFSKKEQGPSIG